MIHEKGLDECPFYLKGRKCTHTKGTGDCSYDFVKRTMLGDECHTIKKVKMMVKEEIKVGETKISIVIPSFNSSKTIKECLNAITKIDYNNYEVIVVDDASKDNSTEIIKKLPCRLIKLKNNVGASEARNIGAKYSKGDILLFMDSDIIIQKDALKLAIDFFNSKRLNVFICSFKPKMRFRNFFSQYKHLYLCYYYEKQDKTLHTLDTSFTFIKKNLFDKFKGFDKKIRISEDADLGVRLTGKGYKIYRNKDIQMEHIKHYTFRKFIKTDLIRGERMSKLFLSSLFGKRKSKRNSFYLKPMNIYISIPIASLFLISTLSSILFKNMIFISAILLSLFIIINLSFWNYLRKINGLFFVFKAGFITLVDMLVMNIGIFLTFMNFIIKRGNI